MIKVGIQNPQAFDAVIIGGGAAGMSAALWCDELGLRTLLLEADPELGGQLLWTYNAIKNHLGIEAENGRAMRDFFVRQLENCGFVRRLNSEVSECHLEKKTLVLKNGEEISARAVIIATGIRRRKLKIEGEEKFRNRGILRSGKRDRDLAAGKKVAVVGGGDAALENALILAETAAEITIIHRRKDFRARAEFLEQAKNDPRIKFLTRIVVQKITGDKKIEALEIKNLQTNEIKLLPVEAVLLRIGVEPNTELFRGQIEMDEHGYIKTDSRCRTSLENVFAVGDAANPTAPTVSSAVGMGATAAKALYLSLKKPQDSK